MRTTNEYQGPTWEDLTDVRVSWHWGKICNECTDAVKQVGALAHGIQEAGRVTKLLWADCPGPHTDLRDGSTGQGVLLGCGSLTFLWPYLTGMIPYQLQGQRSHRSGWKELSGVGFSGKKYRNTPQQRRLLGPWIPFPLRVPLVSPCPVFPWI